MKLQLATILLLTTVNGSPALAQQAQDHGAHHPAAAGEKSATLTEGEVRKIDKEAKKLTIRHGPITNLDMPAMTMVFQVKEPAMLEQVKTGDKIRFSADKISGAYIVTQIEGVR